MNETSHPNSSRTWKIVGLIALILVVVAAVPFLLVSFIFNRSIGEMHGPVPKGQAEIHVEFKGISTEKYNKLNAFVRELAEENSTGSDGAPALVEAASFHGLWNNGYAYQRYRPSHPIPSAEVEKTMDERFKSFLEEHDIDGEGEKLELRYGQ